MGLLVLPRLSKAGLSGEGTQTDFGGVSMTETLLPENLKKHCPECPLRMQNRVSQSEIRKT